MINQVDEKILKILTVFIIVSLMTFWSFALSSNSQNSTPKPVYQSLPESGEKCWLDKDKKHYFIYEFTAKPKLGPVILKIIIKDAAENKVTDMQITGRSDMPEMSGAHDSGEVGFKQNKRGDYLLPVDIVMPGKWEIKLIFLQNNEILFRGFFNFDV